MRLPPTTAALLAAVLLLGACGDDGGSGSADRSTCGPIRREALDPKFLVHVLGDDDVEYTSDPPTSGPHQPSPPVTGVLDAPLPRPVQVGVLEQGDILVQHRPDLPAADLDALRGLADTDGVVVAPNLDLDDPVVATAWVYKRTCSGVDVASLDEFITERRGKGPDDPAS